MIDHTEQIEKWIGLTYRYVNSALKKNPKFNLDEIESAAVEGLWKAIEKNKYGEDGRFITFARLNIKSSIKQYIDDYTGRRNAHKKSLDGGTPICDYIEDRFYYKAEEGDMVQYENSFPDGLYSNNYRALEQFEAWDFVNPFLNGKYPLTNKEKKVIKLRFYKDLGFSEIGVKVGGLTRDGVFYIYTKAISKLRECMNQERKCHG